MAERCGDRGTYSDLQERARALLSEYVPRNEDVTALHASKVQRLFHDLRVRNVELAIQSEVEPNRFLRLI